MQLKTIFNTLLITFLCSCAFAAPSRNDCIELKNTLNYTEIEKCRVNKKGEMTELRFFSTYEDVNSTVHRLNATDYAKILSYVTLVKLDFYDEYSNCIGLNNGISNLKKLEELNIKSFRGTIAPNILRGLKSLKYFTYDAGDYHFGQLSQENINELSLLTNLREIELYYVFIDEDELDFSPLRKLKVSSLKLETNGKNGINLKGLVKNLKHLKELKISNFEIVNQKELDVITSSNIEKLTISLKKKNKLNTDNFQNFESLNYLNLTMKGLKEVPAFIYSIPNLNKLIFNGKEVNLLREVVNDSLDDAGNTANVALDGVGNTVNGNVQDANTNATPIVDNEDDNQDIGNDLHFSSGSSTILKHSISVLPLAILAIKMMF